MSAEMSAPGLLTNAGAPQSIWGPLNNKSTPLTYVPASRSKKSRKKRRGKNVLECLAMCSDLRKPIKRKFSEVEEQDSEIRPSQSNNTDRFEAPSDISLEITQPVKTKRDKISTLPAVATAIPSTSVSESWDADSGFSSETSLPPSGRSSPCIGMNPSMLVAMDCEMVGTGPNGQHSELARCSILNYSGTVIYDKYILPCQPVTNYRTQWSGIKKKHLKNALPYQEAKKEILHVLKGKVIVGHALHNDFSALGISVPRDMTRDTTSMRLLLQLSGIPGKCISLKKLSKKLLNRDIQVGKDGHCSVEDARAALDLYKLVEEQWEKSIQVNHLDVTSEPSISLEHYMQDQYWPESITDCNQ